MKDMCMAVRLLVLSRALVVVGSLLGDLLLHELFMNTNENTNESPSGSIAP